MLTHFAARVAQKSADHRAAPVLIVALGDSVTQGCMELNVVDQEGVYHHQLWRGLISRFRNCVFSVINAGVGGDSSAGALSRLERDVLRHQPDLVLIAFGLNDAGQGPAGLPRFKQNLAALVQGVRGHGPGDVILLTPSFMNSRDNDRVAPEHRQAGIVPRFMEIQNGGTLAQYAQAIRDAGREWNVPVADVYAAWQALADAGTDTTALLANGLNHPNAQAQQIAANALLAIITAALPAAASPTPVA